MTEASPAARPQLVRAIGRWALTAAVVNSVIGSGIFALPAPLAGLTGAWSPIAVLIAGASIFIIVLCFAEIGGRFDQAGGPYLYAREAFGPAAGFHVGWVHVWTRIFSGAAVLNVSNSYLATLIPWTATHPGRTVAMSLAVLVITAINVAGVRQAAWTVNAFTVAKLLPLAAVILLGVYRIDSGVLAGQPVAAFNWTQAVLLLVFSYGGFESAVIAGSESRDPKRDTPFALITAMIVITIVYCLVQLTIVGVLPNAARETTPVSATLGILIGRAGATLGAVAVLISTYGWLTGFALMTPRILFAMGERQELPRFVAHVHPRTRTPAVAIVLNSALTLALALSGSFGHLATVSAISRLIVFAVTCGALIALRRKWGPSERFRAPAGTMLSVAGITFCVWLLSTRSLEEGWFLLVVIGAGLVTQVVISVSRTAAR